MKDRVRELNEKLPPNVQRYQPIRFHGIYNHKEESAEWAIAFLSMFFGNHIAQTFKRK